MSHKLTPDERDDEPIKGMSDGPWDFISEHSIDARTSLMLYSDGGVIIKQALSKTIKLPTKITTRGQLRRMLEVLGGEG